MRTLSVLCPVRNGRKFLNEAISSILCFDEVLEVVVVDGCSSDGTVEYLAEVAHIDDRVLVVSEPDGGPADAVNKALRRASGAFIGWLNADDRYVKGAIVRAISALAAPGSPIMVYGEAEVIDENGRVVGRYPTKTPDAGVSAFSDGCFISQPTVFFKRTLPLVVGAMDVELKTAFDFDYWLRAFLFFEGRIGFIPEVQAQTRWHADAISVRMRREVAIEGIKILKRHLGHAPPHWALTHIEEIKNVGIDHLGDYFDSLLGEVRPYLNDNDYRWVCQVAACANQVPNRAG